MNTHTASGLDITHTAPVAGAVGETSDGCLAIRFFSTWLVQEHDGTWCVHTAGDSMIPCDTESEATEIAAEWMAS